MWPLCIVPARSGSKRIPSKNMKPLAGITPMRRAIQCCRQAFDKEAQIVVTADWIPRDEFDCGVHYHRAADPLHTDTCSMVDVVLDVLRAFPGAGDQSVLLVQPTQPIRRPEHLIEAVRLLKLYPSIASVVETTSVDKLYRLINEALVPVGGGIERDQQGGKTYACDGTVYGFHRDFFTRRKTFRDFYHTHAMVMAPDETCRLDTPNDWLIASLLLGHLNR